ncbi:hypothetical protein [Paracidovorax avenae]|uniref:hypothetical protein n=1 Tax=Paracidovorax avenae TaxID=80867 RepID=UPI001AD8252B|nr:hypothetical protein [Paracidovorax avenae]
MTMTTTITGERLRRPSDAVVPQGHGRQQRRPVAAMAAGVLACAVVAVLTGCGTVAPRPANDPATGTGAQAGESGVTVFGTIDTGVGAVRSSR